jgi:hypothetical protein
VDRVGALPPLRAAGSGACEVAKWLKIEGLDVTLIVDDQKPVLVKDLKDAIFTLVDRPTLEQHNSRNASITDEGKLCWRPLTGPAPTGCSVMITDTRVLSLVQFNDRVPLISPVWLVHLRDVSFEFHHRVPYPAPQLKTIKDRPSALSSIRRDALTS